VNAVKNVSLSVDSGEIATLIGANGAGKTSTLRAISGAVGSRKGEVYLDGKRIDHIDTEKLPALGLVHVPEGRGIFPNLSVAENLEVASAGLESGHLWKSRSKKSMLNANIGRKEKARRVVLIRG